MALHGSVRAMGVSGLCVLLGILAIPGAMILDASYMPLTASSLEAIIWDTWASEAATTSDGRNLADLMAKKDQSAAQRLLADLGRIFADKGEKHAVFTNVLTLRLDSLGSTGRNFETFAEWSQPEASEERKRLTYSKHIVKIVDRGDMKRILEPGDIFGPRVFADQKVAGNFGHRRTARTMSARFVLRTVLPPIHCRHLTMNANVSEPLRKR